ncbi:MAG TPA: VCBS repeat-containing protein, partial [Turneriella sp.]|nr:VCBS repeat-containing protein [Turneriella sp.]
MDADGRTDIVVVRRGGGGWSEWFAVEKSTGSRFVSETWRTPTAAALASSAGDFTVIPGDFNGDGRIDLATVQQVNTQDMSVCESEAMCGTPSASDPWFRGIFVDLNTGSGFVPQYWSAQSPGKMAQAGNTLQFYKILPVDVNADGKTDLVFSRAGGLDNWLTGWNGVLQIEISEGSGFRSEARASSLTTAMTSGGLGAEYELLAGDVNADGLPDLVVMTNHHLPQSGFVGLELSPGSVPDQLIGKQTVFGIREELEYRLSTHLQWAHKPKVGFYSHPFRLWNIPQSVAVRHKLFGNGLLQSHTEYDYRHAKAYIENNGNLRYLGFGEVIEYDRLRGRRRETVYFQEPGYSMKPRHSAAYLPSGKLAHYEEHRPPLWLIEAWHREHPNDDLPELDQNLTYVRSETSENGYGMARVREPVPESMAVEHVRPRLVFHHEGGLSYKTFTDYEGDRPVAVVTAPIDEATDSMLRPSSVGVDELRGQYALELSDRITQAMGLASVVKNDGSISGRKYEVYYSGNDRRNGRPDSLIRDLGRLWDAASQTSSRRQLVTGYVYNQAGLVRSEYSVNNYASKLYDYDYQFGQFVTHTRDCPARARDESATNCVSRYSQFDPRFGKAIMVGDYDKGFDITRYDTVGRPVEALSYDNQGRLLSKLTTNYTEDMNGLTVRACQHFGRDFIQQSCSLTVTDSFGREKLKVTPSVQGEANEVTHTAVQVEYDAQFRKVRESLPYFSDAHGAGTPTSWMVYEYDERDRIVKIVAADGRITRFEHNIPYEECQSVCRPLVGVASRMTTIESGGKRRDIYKNAHGKPLRVVDGARSTHERVTEFEYYPNGKLKTIYAPNDTIKYTYWHAADLVETIETRHGAEGYKYDVSGMALDGSQGTGSLLKPSYVSRYRRGAGGEIIADSSEERRYDQWGRLTATLSNISSPGGMDEETQYLYDESESSFGKGRLTSVRHKSRLNGNVPFDAHGLITASSVCKRLHYDARGRIIGTVTDTSNDPNCLTDMAALPQHAVTTAEFDELGRKTAVVYPDMARSEFRYAGGTGLVSEILHEGSVLAHYRDYNSSGKYGNAVLANGIRQEYTFDDETQLLSQLTVRDSANRP